MTRKEILQAQADKIKAELGIWAVETSFLYPGEQLTISLNVGRAPLVACIEVEVEELRIIPNHNPTPRDIYEVAMKLTAQNVRITQRAIKRALHAPQALMGKFAINNGPHRKAFEAAKAGKPYPEDLE